MRISAAIVISLCMVSSGAQSQTPKDDGVRVGDWVEINGVVGEVTEISLFRTVLLETGNWTDTGHPTGRKVAWGDALDQ
jgi:small-conductance mechanosensitive channel